MRFAYLRKSVLPDTAYLVKEKFLESIKLSTERGWDRYPGMGRCPGKNSGQSYLHVNSLPFLRHWHEAHGLCHPPGS